MTRGHKRLFTKEQEQQICNEYFSKEKPSTDTLAEKWNCDHTTISNILKRNGYKLRTRSEARKDKNYIFIKDQEQQICDEYFSEEKPSCAILAKKWRCSASTIKNIIIKNGYILRTRNEMIKGQKRSEKTKQKIREKSILQHQTQHGPFKDTKPELIMKKLLTESNTPFKHQFRLGKCLFDFHILGTKILIEVDGDYFHGNPKKFSTLNKMQLKMKERDKKHDEVALNNGYILLRFWEDDILRNEDIVKNKLVEVIKQ